MQFATMDSNTEMQDDSVAKITYNVTASDLAKAVISPITDQVVTGEQIKPEITVMNGNIRLTENVDYEVSYGENTEIGEGTVTVKALDSNKNYTGSQTVKFNIVLSQNFIPGVPKICKIIGVYCIH